MQDPFGSQNSSDEPSEESDEDGESEDGENSLNPEQKKAKKAVAPFLATTTVDRSPWKRVRASLKASDPTAALAVAPQTSDVASPATEIANEKTVRDSLATSEIASEKVNKSSESESEEEKISPATKLLVKRFQTSLAESNWRELKDVLNQLPELQSQLVFDHATKLLTAQASTLQPAEVLEFVDAYTPPLQRKQLNNIGALLKGSLVLADQPVQVLRRLQEGTRQLGGSDNDRRLSAARVLFKANMTERAQGFIEIPQDLNSASYDLLLLCSEMEVAALKSVATESDDESSFSNDPFGDSSFDESQEDESAESQEANIPIDKIQKAWLFTSKAWALSKDIKPDHDELTKNLLILLGQLPQKERGPWVDSVRTQMPEDFRNLAAHSLELYAGSLLKRGKEIERKAGLQACALLGESLAKLGNEPLSDWQASMLQLLTTPWINEQYKRFNDTQQIYAEGDNIQLNPLSKELLRGTAPDDLWLQSLPQDTQLLIQRFRGKLAAMEKDRSQVIEAALSLKKDNPKLAQKIVDKYIASCASNGPSWEERLEQTMRQYSHYPPSQQRFYRNHFRQQMANDSNGVSLTRSQQTVNLTKLKEEIAKLNEQNLYPTANAMVDGFKSASSPAEVYSSESLQFVFGDLDSLSTELSLAICQQMQLGLAGQWRNNEVQEQAGTKRTERELALELVRGYDLAAKLAESITVKSPQNLAASLVAGAIRFDQAEYLYGLGSELPAYVALRDRAFEHIQAAAQIYSDQLGQGKTEPNASVFLTWFQMALGASDLSGLTLQSNAQPGQLLQLGKAIRSLPTQVVDTHFGMFAKDVIQGLRQVPAEMKQRCLAGLVETIGEHPAADAAKSVLAYYQSLLSEVELHSQIVGSSTVAHGKPFGLQLTMRYSTALGRESEYFTDLLVKDDQTDNQANLEKEIRAKLAEHFNIYEIRFHQSSVKPRPYGRDNWMETPLAFVLLSAKDASIDTVSPLQVDVTFSDGHGIVRLPIISEKLLIDAKSEQAGDTPISNLAIKQILDARDSTQGRVRLEVVATAKGLLPEFHKLFETRRDSSGNDVIHQGAALTVSRVEDLGVTVNKMVSNNDELTVESERSWFIDFQVDASNGGTTSFNFLKPLQPAEQMLQRYTSTDIEKSDAVVAIELPSAIPKPKSLSYAIAAIAGVLILGVLALWWSRGASTNRPTYQLPSKLTPFSLVAFLHRIANDPRLNFANKEQQTLKSTIQELELKLFKDSAAVSERDLKDIYDQWRRKVEAVFVLER